MGQSVISPVQGKVVVGKPVFICSLHHPDLILTSPIAVSLEHDEGQVIAYAYDLDVFGYGDTENEALNDLRRTIIDLFEELREEQDHLTGEALAVWTYLSHTVSDTGSA